MLKKVLLLSMAFSLVVSCSSKTILHEEISQSDEVKIPDIFITSSEYKLLLLPDKFENIPAGYERYWDIVRKAAAEENVTVIPNKNPLKEKNRDVTFFDTESLELQSLGYSLRLRQKYKDGELLPEWEYTLKFTTNNPEELNHVNMNVSEEFQSVSKGIEYELDIVYFSEEDGRKKLNYTAANAIITDSCKLVNIKDLIKVFPFVQKLDLEQSRKLSKIAGVTAFERKVELGTLDFGDELLGEMSISVWTINLENDTMIIPEFSFSHDFNPDREYDSPAMDSCQSFLKKLNNYAPDWTAPGSSKSAKIFAMHKKEGV